jgi:hypothetical protein
MTVSVVGSASVGNTNNTDVSSVACSKPSGTASGDFMVAIFTAPYTGSLTYTPPSGWTLVNSSAGGGGVSLWSGLYTKTAGGSEPSSYTFGCSAAGSMTVGIVTYRGTDGTFSSASGGNPRVNTGTTTNPQSISPLASIVGTGLATFACSWHDAGGSGDTSGGSASQASTEQWDLARTDGSPSTHERGSSCYTLNAEYTNGSNNPTSATITLSGAPTSYVNWTWGLKSVVSGAAASTLGGVTASASGSESVAVYRSTATAVSTAGTNVSSLTINKPTGTVDDDYMIAVISTNSSTVTPPAGWTLLEGPTLDGSGLSSLLYQKKAASEGSSYTWNFGSSGGKTGSISSFSNSIGVDTWQSHVNSTTDPAVGSALTPTGPSVRYDVFAWREQADATVTWDKGTETHDIVTNNSAGVRVGQSGTYETTSVAGGGTMSAATADPTGTLTFSIMWSIAVGSKGPAAGNAASTLGGATSSATGSVVPISLSVVGKSTYNNPSGTDVSTVVIPKVTGTMTGDFMVAVVNGPYDGTHTWTAPSGWTLVNQANTGAVSLESLVYTKTAGGSEPSSYTWTYGGTAGAMNGGILCYRGTSGFTTVTSGLNPKANTGTTANPQSIPTLANSTTSGRTTFCTAWHTTGGAGLTSSGNAGTEQWDFKASDNAGTNERGTSAYVYNSSFNANSGNSGAQTTLSSAPTSYVSWAWALDDVIHGAGASVLGGVTDSGTGNGRIPEGAITTTVGHITSSGTGIVKGAKIEFLINGSWTDVTQFVRYADGVDITRGRTSSGTTMTTSMAHFNLDNRDGRFSLKDPTGIYYGYIGRNIQCRITKQEAGYRFWGEVSSWAHSADTTNSDRYVKIECSGVTRRLDATTAPTNAAMYREVMSASTLPIGYWPCDDAAGATSFSSPIPGVANLAINGSPDMQNYSGLKTAGSIPQVNTSVWKTPTLPLDHANGLTLSFLLASPGGMTSGATLCGMAFVMVDNSGTPFTLNPEITLKYSATNQLTLDVFPHSISGGSIVGTVPIVGKNGIMVYIAMDVSGSTTGNFDLWYQGEDDANPVHVGSSGFAYGGAPNVISNVASIRFNGGGYYNWDVTDFSNNSAAYIGQIAAWKGYGPTNTLSYSSVGAYSGEAAGTRFARLCTEEGITAVVNDPTNSQPMGPQLPKKLTDLLRECEATDQGIMYEPRDTFGLGYIVGRDLLNKSVDLSLDYDAGDLSSQLQPTFDDKDVQNDVTVQRDGGSSARYIVSSNSALSTQDPPLGVGRYQSSATVSLWEDEQCYPQAGWRAHLGTVDEERITSVGITMQSENFINDQSKSDDAYSVDSGSRITVSNAPDWIGGTVDQIVQGYTERFDTDIHTITYNTDSASPYSTATAVTLPTSTTSKVGSLTSSLASDIDDNDTSISVTVTGVLWTVNASADFDIEVGGEVMNVTAVSGTSSPQTFTVTRSVNSVVKSQTAGAQIKLYKPAIVAL